MKFSASAGFAALLAITLGAKFLSNVTVPEEGGPKFDHAARSMLEAAGFAASSEARPFGTLYHGSKGACRLIVGEYDPHGTFAELFRHFAAPVGPLRFAWRGQVTEEAPKTPALFHFYVWRELLRVGVATPREPIAAWAASPDCDTPRLDWTRIGHLPA
jgi:hypothetical protein